MASPARIVLAINAGSSSLKFGLYSVGDGAEMLASGEEDSLDDPIAAAGRVFQGLDHSSLPKPEAIGHRIVHGGPNCVRHALIDADILHQLEGARAFAPLHVPEALKLIGAAREHYPDLAQIACLDTAFHADLPDMARVLALPRALLGEGVHRYGFHGLSCESIVRQLGERRPERPRPHRLVIAHLGSGASVTAVLDGRSIDTSMGLTPSGGVIMGSRSGDLDPGILLYLLREKKLDADGLEILLDRHSGLLGISGLSKDVRKLRATDNAAAALALAMFAYSVRKQIAGMAAALNGIDLLVFTGGIGEHDPAMRDDIVGGLGWAGIGAVLVLPSDENRQIALHAARLA